MNSRILPLISFAILAILLLSNLLSDYTTRAALNTMQRQVADMDMRLRARNAILSFKSLDVPSLSDHLCAATENRPRTGICKTLEAKVFNNVGLHDDLWVFFDAVTVLSRRDLDGFQRGRLDAYLANITSQLSTFDAWSISSAGDYQILTASDYYRSMLASAFLCNKLAADFECKKGLPLTLRHSVLELASYLEEIGPTVASYEMSSRIDAVRSISRNLE